MKQAIILSLSISNFAMSDITKAGCSPESQRYNNSGEVMQSKIYKCAGIIKSGGVYGDDAASLCNTGFHVCKSATEMMNMGFTHKMCNELPQDGEFWATKETSQTSCACFSYQWQIGHKNDKRAFEFDDWTGNGMGRNDIFGCAKETLVCQDQPCVNGKGINSRNEIFALNAALGGDYGERKKYTHWIPGDKTAEASSARLDDPSAGGVLCCTDNVNKKITASPTASPTAKVEAESPEEEATSSSAFLFIIIIFVICCAVSGCN